MHVPMSFKFCGGAKPVLLLSGTETPRGRRIHTYNAPKHAHKNTRAHAHTHARTHTKGTTVSYAAYIRAVHRACGNK
jgi:hypothetical protein